MSEILSADDDFLNKLVTSFAFIDQAIPGQKMGIRDKAFILRYCSSAFAEGVGFTAQEIIGKIYWLPGVF